MYMDYKPVRGYNAYLTMGSTDANTGLDVGLLILEPGDAFAIDEPEKDAGTAEEPVDSETGMEKTEENESGAIISDTEIEKEIESEDNSETDEEDSIS